MQFVALCINLLVIWVAVVRRVRVHDLVRACVMSQIAWQWLLFHGRGQRTAGAQRNDEARQMHNGPSIEIDSEDASRHGQLLLFDRKSGNSLPADDRRPTGPSRLIRG